MLVAHYLNRIRFLNGDPFTNVDAVRFCRERSIDPFPVLMALKAIRSGERSYSVSDINYIVDDKRWEERKRNYDTACCPIPWWSIGKVAGAQKYDFFPCTSWRCPTHSRPKGDALLEAAKVNFMAYPVIYHCVVEYTATMVDRIRARHRSDRAGGEALFVALDNGELHFFATKVLGSRRKPPHAKDWEALLPEEALERLATTLTLPGVVNRSWSDGWPVSETHSGDTGLLDDSDDGTEAEVDPPKTEAQIRLPSVQTSTRGRALEIARRRAKERWGITPTEDSFPGEVGDPAEWAEMLKQAVVQVRNENAWARAAEWYSVTASQ
jgi:hypothetical protein